MTEKYTENNLWEQKTIKELLFGSLIEQRRKRRWRIFFLLLAFGYLFFVTFVSIYKTPSGFTHVDSKKKTHAGVINITGIIAQDTEFSAENIIKSLQNAAKNKSCMGIILRIDSAGGTPVQTRQIFNAIKGLKKDMPDFLIYAAIEDFGASGAYLVASAADKIYADETSIVGSIGVLINSFGFTDAMQKLGIERRLYTAGEYKGMLDPFSPRNAEDEAFIKTQLELVHKQFIDNVRKGRGNRLQETPDLYSGRFWVGEQAKQLGLIDEFGDVYNIARDVFDTPKIVDYTVSYTMIDRLAKKFGLTTILPHWLVMR